MDVDPQLHVQGHQGSLLIGDLLGDTTGHEKVSHYRLAPCRASWLQWSAHHIKEVCKIVMIAHLESLQARAVLLSYKSFLLCSDSLRRAGLNSFEGFRQFVPSGLVRKPYTLVYRK